MYNKKIQLLCFTELVYILRQAKATVIKLLQNEK